MKIVNYCVCCDGKNLIITPAKLYAFVYERMLDLSRSTDDINCHAIECLSCGYVGINVRFDQDEEQRYYKGYMAEEYILRRCHYEGDWLRPMLDDYNSGEYKNLRKHKMFEILSKVLTIDHITAVLDYGGDDGSLIPDQLKSAERFNKEINGKSTVADIKSVSTPDNMKSVDLVICAHTLEHVSYPIEILNDIKRYLRSGGWVYIEVPDNEPPNKENFHEHINLFRLPVLEKILSSNGFINVQGFKIDYNDRLIDSAISVMAQLP